MAEDLSLLSEVEQQALTLKEALPRARAIETWLSYSALQGFSPKQIQTGIEDLRGMKAKRLKKIRKQLTAAVKLEETLPQLLKLQDSTLDQLDDVSLPEPSFIPDPASIESAEAIPAEASSQLDQPTGTIVEQAGDGTAPSAGLKWVRESLGMNVEDGISIEELVKKIIEVAQPSVTYIGKNRRDRPVDAEKRIRQRVQGRNYTEIALDEEGSTAAAVQQWFSTRIIKPFKRTAVGDAPELPVDPTSIPEPMIKLAPSPAIMAFRTPRMEAAESTIDSAPLAEFWAEQMKLDINDTELLIQALDPNYSLELTGSHRSKLHHFRQFMEKHLPRLEDSDLDLTSNEVARLARLLGRTESGGEYSFTAKPQSAREVSMVDGYIVPQQRTELLSGLYKLHNYMRQGQDYAEVEVVVSQLKEALKSIGYSDEHVQDLEVIIGLREAEALDPARANEAIRRLQALFAGNAAKLDGETDRDLMSSLRMLTNMAMGRKTVNDVYYRLHSKDNSVTRQSVTQMLESGIIKLAM